MVRKTCTISRRRSRIILRYIRWSGSRGSRFLDILGRSELTQSEQARLTVRARLTRLNAERNIILWAGLASGFAGNATRIYLASCRIENIFVRSHAWIMAYIHWQDGEKASDSLK